MIMKYHSNSKYFISYSTSIYKLIIVGFLCFSFIYSYNLLGVSSLSIFIYLLFSFFGSILLYPLLNSKKPLYEINESGIRQNKYYFLKRNYSWSEIKSISYPSGSLFGGKSSITLHQANKQSFIVNLSEINTPLLLLESIDKYKPFGFKQYETQNFFNKHHDKERFFYITVLYLCVGIAVLVMATFDMPYVWLEDNKYNVFWAVLFFGHLFFSIFAAIFAYKDIQKRKSLVKSIILIWLFLFIGPFVVENNAYYNVRAIMAEKKGDYSSAEIYIRKAIEIHPDGYTYYETLGKALFGLERFSESIDVFNFLLKNDQRLTDYYNAYYYMWIGKSYVKLGIIDEAKKAFEETKKINNDKFNKEIEIILKSNS